MPEQTPQPNNQMNNQDQQQPPQGKADWSKPKTWIPVVAATAIIIVYLVTAAQANIWPFAPVAKEDPAADSALSEVEGWQTYRNEEYGFEFRYPSTYSLAEIGYASFGLVVELDRDVTTEYLEGAGEQLESGSKINFEIDPDAIASVSQDIYISRFYGGPYLSKQVNIDNHTAIEFSGSSPWAKYLVNTFIDPDINYFGYNLYVGRSTLNEKLGEYIKDYEAIKKTIKFTDSPDTANWQTYRNEEYGFAVKYPPEFSVKWFEYEDEEDPAPGIQSTRGIEFIRDGETYFSISINDTIIVGGAPLVHTGQGELATEDVIIKKQRGYSVQDPDSHFVRYLFDFQGNRYEGFAVADGADLIEEKENLIDQILSTFKFIN